MTSSARSDWIALHPPLRSVASRNAFAAHMRALAKAQQSENDVGAIDDLRAAFTAATVASSYIDRQTLLAASLVVSDLAIQGWCLRVRKAAVEVCPPRQATESRAAEKARIRRQELVKRDAQLRQPAVQAFLRSMERSRLHGSRFVSIFSVMRDGRELAHRLREVRGHDTKDWTEAVRKVVDPYLEFVASDIATCSHTGLRLMDIWRYFRHTWTNQYTSVPGRSMLFLVRDRAAAFHPIIGIGALCSPIMQLRERDAWVGWQPDTFLERVRSNPSPALAEWLVGVLDTAIAEIYIDDLIEDGILSARDLTVPHTAVVERLLKESTEQRQLHHRFARQREHKRRFEGPDSVEGWVARARSHLFRSKRALALATYLRVRSVLQETGGERLTAKQFATLANSARGSDSILKILRKAKADRIGICVADISVCGAVQPYNAILGGKLVAMLAASPEVALEYRRRYGAAESEIASAMAGRPIVRAPNLVLLGTTSLYGVGSSQYNRIRVPCERVGGYPGSELRYVELGHSEAFGTSQYSDETVEALTDLVQQSENGQRVNSIFGEGVSPKFRKIRHGLELLDFPSDLLLKHHRHRIVYAVSLVRNLSDYLLGLDPEPHYVVPLDDGPAATARIAAWWRERWLRHRIESDDVLVEVEGHTLVRPIRHGARVSVISPKDQPSLFTETEV